MYMYIHVGHYFRWASLYAIYVVYITVYMYLCGQIKGHWDEYLEYCRVIQGEGKKAVTESPKQLWRAIPHKYACCVCGCGIGAAP